jgi:hypothetical protein
MTATFVRRRLRPARRFGLSFVGVVVLVIAVAPVAVAHAPSVLPPGNESPATAHPLEDPTLSRAIGATLDAPGEVDWYRMELLAGDPLVVEVTAPDATGGIAASFDLLGPGLPAPATDVERELASLVDAEGVVRHAPEGGEREVHGGLGFIAWGGIRTTAPADGTYWIAVRASEPDVTGKYVLAPGVREEFGLDAIGGMADLVAFFDAPWPPEPGATVTGGADRLVAVVVGAAVVLVLLGIVVARLRGRQLGQRTGSRAAS